MGIKDSVKQRFQRKEPTGDKARTIAWNTLLTILTITKEASDDIPIPGLRSAIGGLLAVVQAIQVGP